MNIQSSRACTLTEDGGLFLIYIYIYVVICGKAKSASEKLQIKFAYVEGTHVLLFVASHVTFHGTLYTFTGI